VDKADVFNNKPLVVNNKPLDVSVRVEAQIEGQDANDFQTQLKNIQFEMDGDLTTVQFQIQLIKIKHEPLQQEPIVARSGVASLPTTPSISSPPTSPL
jgi:hypothetical protein